MAGESQNSDTLSTSPRSMESTPDDDDNDDNNDDDNDDDSDSDTNDDIKNDTDDNNDNNDDDKCKYNIVLNGSRKNFGLELWYLNSHKRLSFNFFILIFVLFSKARRTTTVPSSASTLSPSVISHSRRRRHTNTLGTSKTRANIEFNLEN